MSWHLKTTCHLKNTWTSLLLFVTYLPKLTVIVVMRNERVNKFFALLHAFLFNLLISSLLLLLHLMA